MRGPSELAQYDNHCTQDRFPRFCGDLATEPNFIYPSYPQDITCWSNAHSINVKQEENLRMKDAEGRDLIHVYGLKFNQDEYTSMLKKYSWDVRQKILSPADLAPYIDFDFGIGKFFGKHQMQVSDKNRCKIEEENLAYAASLKTTGKDTQRRLGPPKLTASQEYTQASWLYHVMAPHPERKTVWPQRGDDANAGAGPSDPRGSKDTNVLESWLKIPPSPKPCFHPAFPYYNAPHAQPIDQQESIPRSPDSLGHIPSPCLVGRQVERINSWFHGKKYKFMSDLKHKQLRRRQVEDTMTCPKKRQLFLAIIEKIRAEVNMEVNSPVRKRTDIPLFQDRLLKERALPSPKDDVPPISDQALFTERATSSPNQLVTVEIQINPSMSRAMCVDKNIPTPEGDLPTTTIV